MFKSKILRIILHEGDDSQKKEDLMEVYKQMSEYQSTFMTAAPVTTVSEKISQSVFLKNKKSVNPNI